MLKTGIAEYTNIVINEIYAACLNNIGMDEGAHIEPLHLDLCCLPSTL